MKVKYQQLSTVELHSNPYWKIKHDKYILPNYKEGNYYYIDSFGSVLVIPWIDEHNILMVRQYRYLNRRYSIELPGGGVRPQYTISENAQLELSEETGYKSNQLTKIGEFNPYIGVTNEICTVFEAKELIENKLLSDDSEEVEILKININEIKKYITVGEIWNGMTLAAWTLYNNKK